MLMPTFLKPTKDEIARFVRYEKANIGDGRRLQCAAHVSTAAPNTALAAPHLWSLFGLIGESGLRCVLARSQYVISLVQIVRMGMRIDDGGLFGLGSCAEGAPSPMILFDCFCSYSASLQSFRCR